MVAGGSGVKSWADGDMVSGGCYLPWPSELWGPDVPVKTTDKKKKKNHGIALQHASVVLKERSCREPPQDTGTTVHTA